MNRNLFAALGCLLLVACPAALPAAESNAAPLFKVAAVQMRSSRNLADNLTRITNWIHDCARQRVRDSHAFCVDFTRGFHAREA